jgi:hypothetical protein
VYRFGYVQIAAALLLAGSLLVGLAFAALLPPFEGFDETAHYSYLAQIAETGTWPRLSDPLAADVSDYLNVAPSASSLHSRWSYRAFFSASRDAVSRGRAAAQAPRDPSRSWRPAIGTANWEGQQPPLYYAMLAPAFRLSMGWSLERQLVLLRSISYFVAWLGLCIVTFATGTKIGSDTSEKAMIALAPALWPAVFPMWFVEMGRLGNDCVVAFWAACAAVLILGIGSKGGFLNHLKLGIVCALGLLTKATFLPLTAAILLILSYRLWIAKNNEREFQSLARGLAVFMIIILVIAGWWYGNNLYHTGTLIGSNDEAHLPKGNLLALVLSKIRIVSTRAFLLAGLGTAVSFLWVGTWSFVMPPLVSELPLAALVAVVAAGYVWASIKTPPRLFERIYPLTFVLFVAGLLRQALILFVEIGTLSVPAWYIHSLAPLFAPMLGRGLAEAGHWRSIRAFIGALLVFPIFFLPFGTGIIALYYAGCGDQDPGHSFSSVKRCFSNFGGGNPQPFDPRRSTSFNGLACRRLDIDGDWIHSERSHLVLVRHHKLWKTEQRDHPLTIRRVVEKHLEA